MRSAYGSNNPWFRRAKASGAGRIRASGIDRRGTATVDPILTEIGACYGRSAAQVVLRWLVQRGVVVIPKSVRADRMKENIDVFDFELTDEQMARIAAMNTGASLFLDHRDPAVVRQLGSFRIHN